METLMKADIFFFVTTIAVVVVTVLLAMALFYVIKILKDFRDISDILKRGVENASERVEEILERMEDNPVYKFFFSKKRSSKKHKKDL